MALYVFSVAIKTLLIADDFLILKVVKYAQIFQFRFEHKNPEDLSVVPNGFVSDCKKVSVSKINCF